MIRRTGVLVDRNLSGSSVELEVHSSGTDLSAQVEVHIMFSSLRIIDANRIKNSSPACQPCSIYEPAYAS